ncbi:hypothetical protein PMAYCL1PPCAC_20539 [Pristionchus mayeri]|uniref:G protein-coupled receptor n=1 Tax=Pristionchus mayeri TaxID=1317129 RepID=A0AAN5CTJ4_9BILA|nr:hypothetical protein PMAYCL1PPCAC_20539 [Pristionchus mayeri]
MSADELPIFVHGVHNLCTISSVVFDGLLLQSIYEILTSISTFIVFPRVIPLGLDGIVVVTEGPCRVLPMRICFGVYSVLLNAVARFLKL